MKQLVIVESPYAGDIEENIKYAKECVKDCFERDEIPFASHLFYTQEGILDDDDPEQRKLGIEAGLRIAEKFNKTVIYIDKGISSGMVEGLLNAANSGRVIEFRSLDSEHVLNIEYIY